MPRNPGTGIYTKPYPDVISDTTIESTVHNGEIADIETDLNTPRPIVAGGTGANNAATARDNLDTEVAAATVTNFDTQVWECGSFWCGPNTTAAPTVNAFAGTCIILAGTPQYIMLEARDASTGRMYTRIKSTTWGAWTAQDADYVNTIGDTMTGDLIIDKANPALWLRKGLTSEASAMLGMSWPRFIDSLTMRTASGGRPAIWSATASACFIS